MAALSQVNKILKVLQAQGLDVTKQRVAKILAQVQRTQKPRTTLKTALDAPTKPSEKALSTLLTKPGRESLVGIDKQIESNVRDLGRRQGARTAQAEEFTKGERQFKSGKVTRAVSFTKAEISKLFRERNRQALQGKTITKAEGSPIRNKKGRPFGPTQAFVRVKREERDFPDTVFALREVSPNKFEVVPNPSKATLQAFSAQAAGRRGGKFATEVRGGRPGVQRRGEKRVELQEGKLVEVEGTPLASPKSRQEAIASRTLGLGVEDIVKSVLKKAEDQTNPGKLAEVAKRLLTAGESESALSFATFARRAILEGKRVSKTLIAKLDEIDAQLKRLRVL